MQCLCRNFSCLIVFYDVLHKTFNTFIQTPVQTPTYAQVSGLLLKEYRSQFQGAPLTSTFAFLRQLANSSLPNNPLVRSIHCLRVSDCVRFHFHFHFSLSPPAYCGFCLLLLTMPWRTLTIISVVAIITTLRGNVQNICRQTNQTYCQTNMGSKGVQTELPAVALIIMQLHAILLGHACFPCLAVYLFDLRSLQIS